MAYQLCHIDVSRILTYDVKVLEEYFTKWRLRPSKTIVTAVHSSIRLANAKLDVSFCGKSVQNKPHPKYLGITVDHSMHYREHLKKEDSSEPHP